MYAGSTFTRYSGRILGTHQKIDRLSRKALSGLLSDDKAFPSKRLLLHFEGKNGPDGIKLKSTGRDEPWHYFDPYDPDEGDLLGILQSHFEHLITELKSGNKERAAFEAAWLSHAILDGLTPSHHYPYEAKLEELRGESRETRDSYYKKIVVPGESASDVLLKNWKVWGVKGIATTHYFFELGAATVMLPAADYVAEPNRYEIKSIQHLGLLEYFKRTAREVAMYDMYEQFYKRGWTPKLAKIVRHELTPRMAKTVTLAWYLAAKEAGFASGEV